MDWDVRGATLAAGESNVQGARAAFEFSDTGDTSPCGLHPAVELRLPIEIEEKLESVPFRVEIQDEDQRSQTRLEILQKSKEGAFCCGNGKSSLQLSSQDTDLKLTRQV